MYLHQCSVRNNPKSLNNLALKTKHSYTFITEGVGSELCGNHLVVIIQNKKANIYSEKVNVLPIEGDGTKINPNYQVRLSSAELADGKLDKEPSRIIVTDITTIDKARLGRRIGRLTPECLAAVEKLLKNHLEL